MVTQVTHKLTHLFVLKPSPATPEQNVVPPVGYLQHSAEATHESLSEARSASTLTVLTLELR